MNPIITYPGLMKVNSGKARARNDEDIETLNQIGLFWHPHKVVLPFRRDDPIFVCQITHTELSSEPDTICVPSLEIATSKIFPPVDIVINGKSLLLWVYVKTGMQLN